MAKSKKRARAAGPVETATPIGYKRDIVAFAVLLAAVLVVFGRTLGFGFVNWDDPTNILDNPQLLAEGPGRWWSFWIAPYADLYVPLTYTSWLLDLEMSGGRDWLAATRWPKATIFHATNLMCHWVAACAVFGLLRMVLGAAWRAALMGALLFAVHPLQAEPVSWVTGRKDVLSGALALVSLAYWTAWLQRGGRWRYAIATGLYLGALLSKPSAVVVPVLAALVAWYIEVPWRRWIGWLGPWLVASLLFVLITQSAQSGIGNSDFQVAAWKRVFVASDTLLFYLLKMLLPFGLVPLYERTNTGLFAGWWVWLSPVVVMSLAGAVWRFGRRGWLVAGLFVVPLLPVSGVVPFFYQHLSNVADRYAYLSVAAIAATVAMVLGRGRNWWGGSMVLIAVLAATSFRQSGFWRDSESLWKRQLAIRPGSETGNYLLARHYLETRNLEAARHQYLTTIKVSPAYPDSYNDLMALAESQGDTAVFKSTAEQALIHVPAGSAEKMVARGRAHLALGQYAEAADAYRSAVATLPDDAEVQRNLALALLRLNNFAGAAKAAKRAASLDPASAQTRDIFAVALFKQGRLAEAAQQMAIAVQLAPDNQSYQDKLTTMKKAANQ